MKRLAVMTILAALCVSLMNGCATFGTYETAQTTPQGKLGWGAAITPMHVYGGSDGTGFLFFPLPELSAKLGLSNSFELGARWGFGPGMTFSGKYCFTRGPVDAAFAAYGSLYGMAVAGASFGTYSLSPRIIISNEAEGSFPFSANAGLGFGGVFAGGMGTTASGSVFSAAAGVGLPYRLGSRRDIRLMPELSLSVPIVSSYKAGSESGSQSLMGNFSASLGISFGSVPQGE